MTIELTTTTKIVATAILKKATAISIDIFNQGANPFTAFEIWFSATLDSPGTRWLYTTADFTDPHDKAPMRGVSVDAGDPTVLAAGAAMSVALEGEFLKAYSQIVVKAASTGGTTTQIKINTV